MNNPAKLGNCQNFLEDSQCYTVVLIRVRYFVLLNYSTNLGQLSKPVTVLESARPKDSKTVPESLIWPRFGWDNQGKRQ